MSEYALCPHCGTYTCSRFPCRSEPFQANTSNDESTSFVNAADIVNPSDSHGRTFREINNAKQHKFKVGQKVELKEGNETLIVEVVKQTRDCDGTPLYSLAKYDGHGYNENMLKAVLDFRGYPCGADFEEQSNRLIKEMVELGLEEYQAERVLPVFRALKELRTWAEKNGVVVLE